MTVSGSNALAPQRVTCLEHNALACAVVRMLTADQLRQLANFIRDRWLDGRPS